jgi:hypothetical protein
MYRRAAITTACDIRWAREVVVAEGMTRGCTDMEPPVHAALLQDGSHQVSYLQGVVLIVFMSMKLVQGCHHHSISMPSQGCHHLLSASRPQDG